VSRITFDNIAGHFFSPTSHNHKFLTFTTNSGLVLFAASKAPLTVVSGQWGIIGWRKTNEQQ
jgi:hypothetical protein